MPHRDLKNAEGGEPLSLGRGGGLAFLDSRGPTRVKKKRGGRVDSAEGGGKSPQPSPCGGGKGGGAFSSNSRKKERREVYKIKDKPAFLQRRGKKGGEGTVCP